MSLSKPVTSEYASGVLQSVLIPMTNERRRYFRYQVELPVVVSGASKEAFRTIMMNISDGGMAIRLPGIPKLKGIVQVEFELPSIAPFLVEIKVEVVWSDWQRAGRKFRYMSPEARQRFGDRLSVLETRGASVKRCLFIAALSGDDQAYSRFVLPQSESSQCARFVRTVENSSAGRFHAA